MTEPPPRRSRSFGCLGCMAVAVVLVIVAGILVTLWDRAETNSVRERFAARGLPTSLQELDDWYEYVPEEENAAIGFMAAGNRIFPTETLEEQRLPIVTNLDSPKFGLVLDDETANTAREYLHKNLAALEYAHAAAKLEKSRYPLDLSVGVAGVGTQLQANSELRDVVRLLCLEALVRTHDGDTAGAVESLSAMYAAARSLANEPVMLSQLVVLAIEGLSAECTCNALSARQFPGEDLDRIAALATSGDIRDSYYRAVVGEAAFGLFDNSPTNPLSNPLSMFDRHAYVDAIEAVLDTADLPLRDAITAVRALDIYPDMTGPRPVAGQSTYYARLHPFSSILIPPMLRTFGAAARGEIYRELVHLITAIESYRLEHNAPPENLDQLVPDYLETLPQDPYSNVTYQYLPTNPGYAVYSLGPNRQDDQAEKLTNTTGDINLRITR